MLFVFTLRTQNNQLFIVFLIAIMNTKQEKKSTTNYIKKKELKEKELKEKEIKEKEIKEGGIEEEGDIKEESDIKEEGDIKEEEDIKEEAIILLLKTLLLKNLYYATL
ncbi:hypothetical protein MBM_09713 [Drepanopeziza brunnea f. sp. 'multigermtubi' MB_m1]|uniref:Uncharacterized protein n=1 Tax=Marssonina brunnea f. sp. multigermtubi (strain MB_m1) TaxID=1072389 RepID=K1WU94_MARBU|nr:uncharacterized protein MBM_09713 [Drepanopeziza brunnea f. sp. 'multigermtubi' MB_m1]EKD12133.1 hypothetical protein MBM_09713 [Drepanopeziza brunnea f. sp. 'multigermtubi' MB_m1]